MVAYSFKQRFVPAILSGAKGQTIRAVGKRRHAHPADAMQLYTGMRTRQCHLIGRAFCRSVEPISISVSRAIVTLPSSGTSYTPLHGLDDFARSDGFADWYEMRLFWEVEHPDSVNAAWSGVLLKWFDFRGAEHATP